MSFYTQYIRMYYTVPYTILLYHTILYDNMVYNSLLYFIIPFYTTLQNILRPYTILYYTVLYSSILFYTIPYYTVLYYTILHYTLSHYTTLDYTMHYNYRYQRPSGTEPTTTTVTFGRAFKNYVGSCFAQYSTRLGIGRDPLKGPVGKHGAAGPGTLSTLQDSCFALYTNPVWVTGKPQLHIDRYFPEVTSVDIAWSSRYDHFWTSTFLIFFI